MFALHDAVPGLALMAVELGHPSSHQPFRNARIELIGKCGITRSASGNDKLTGYALSVTTLESGHQEMDIPLPRLNYASFRIKLH
jgi:hypothetical protein